MPSRREKRCPICKKPVKWDDNPYRPFCSERCKKIDLGQWASEEYRIPGEKMTDDKDKQVTTDDAEEK